MNSAPEQTRWLREENFPPHEALGLRSAVSVLPGAVRSYVSDHGVSESLARDHLLDLVEEAAVNGVVLKKTGESLMRLALPQRLGKYHVMIDTRTFDLFAYSNHTGATTWVESRNRAASAAQAAEQLRSEQKAAARRRRQEKSAAPCLTWSGQPAGRPEPGAPLRVWRQLRKLDVAMVLCNRAVRDCVYFSAVPEQERLDVIRAQLRFLLARVSERQVAPRPEVFTIEDGPIAWHLRRDGRLLEQITVRGGHAQARFTPGSLS